MNMILKLGISIPSYICNLTFSMSSAQYEIDIEGFDLR